VDEVYFVAVEKTDKEDHLYREKVNENFLICQKS